MKQAIAGVAPADLGETTVMTVWPSISLYPTGRWLGRRYAWSPRKYKFMNPAVLVAALTIPIAIVLYFRRIFFGSAIRYRLTNKRILVERGVMSQVEHALELDGFDAIDIEVLDGQAWFNAGDLVFRQGDVVALRLGGVSRPEAFRTICLNSHRAYVGVKKALGGAATA